MASTVTRRATPPSLLDKALKNWFQVAAVYLTPGGGDSVLCIRSKKQFFLASRVATTRSFDKYAVSRKVGIKCILFVFYDKETLLYCLLIRLNRSTIPLLLSILSLLLFRSFISEVFIYLTCFGVFFRLHQSVT